MAWRWELVREQRRQLVELIRLFAAQFWENDLVSAGGDMRGLLIGILAVLAVPGWILPVLECIVFSDRAYADAPLYQRDWIAVPHKTVYLGLSMTILGIVTVLEWDTLLPSQRDYAVLRPLPIRPGTVLAAKTATLIGFWAVATAALNAVSAVIFPVAVIQYGSLLSLLRTIRAHAISVAAGNAFIFLAVMAVQGLLMNLMGSRRFRRVAPYFQLLLIAILLLMFFSSVDAASRLDPTQPLDSIQRLLPTMWFLGLYQYQLGWHQVVFGQLTGLAQHALAIAAVVALLSYALSYGRSISRSLEDLESDREQPRWFTRTVSIVVDRVLLHTPSERAAFHFVRQTVLRSRSHRVLVAAYAGAGLGLVFQGLTGAAVAGDHYWWRHPEGALLPVPLVLSLFLLLGLLYAFTVPAELRANWLFQVGAASDPREYRSGVRKAVMLTGILPLFSVLLLVHALLWGWYLACVHLAFGFAVACLIMDVMLAGFDSLPFTCSYVAGKANVKTYWVIYVLAFMAYVSAFSGIELLVLRRPVRLLWFLALVVLAQAAIDFYRRRTLPGTFSLESAGDPQPAVRTLGLSQ